MKAIQDQLRGNHCYGCGPDNPDGMHLKSYWDGETSRCEYRPKATQCAGPTQYVYGGTIASIIDCHSIGTAIAAFYDKEGRSIGDGEEIWCVTGKLDVNYLAPTPIESTILLKARVLEMTGKKAVVECTATADGTETARASVIAVRVPDSWRGS